jgi:hypothetical protein
VLSRSRPKAFAHFSAYFGAFQSASVRSGMISETLPTNVVLPAPNPPEMTIFVEAAAHPSECS